jgi:N-acetylglucosamine-6-sulfatase
VFVLTDDLDWSLVTAQYMPHVIAPERNGETFDHYIVANSLCCPSRSSNFTGLFPHDSGVYTNTGADGGYYAFTHHKPNLETRTFAVVMQKAGYLTSMMGKYLNGYGEPAMTTQVPPGWSDWHVAGNAYPEFNYDLNENGAPMHYGPGPPPATNAANYLTDVLAARASTFIDRASAAHKPFVMEVATFAPHRPYTPAPRNRHDFPGLGAPRDPSFNAGNVNPPDWLGKRKRLTPAQVAKIDREYRMRAQAVEAVDRLLGLVETRLAARGLTRNTYIVFSPDNGYHMGQHRLLAGKETAFDTDIRVPLIIAGPGVPQGRVISQVVQNVDLDPTFVQLAGGRPVWSVDGP